MRAFIAPLVALATAVLVSAAHADGLVRPLDSGHHDYVGVAKCKTCHKKELIGDQYGAWLEGPHKRAYQTLSSAHSLAIAEAKGLTGPPNQSADCLRCHVSAYAVPAVRIANPVSVESGVGCESCHGPGRSYRKKKIMSDPDQAAAKGLWDVASHAGVCEACHNPESPTYDPARYVLTDGATTGFDFEIAKSRVLHPIPEHVKGRYLELEKEQKKAEKAAAGK
jgi:hypothetical protein